MVTYIQAEFPDVLPRSRVELADREPRLAPPRRTAEAAAAAAGEARRP